MSKAIAELERADQARKYHKLGGWEMPTAEVKLPVGLHIAVFTHRPQLLATCVRPMDADEVRQVLDLVAVLIETNRALQAHAQELASRCDWLHDNFRGVSTALDKLRDMAEFRDPDEEEQDTD